jgi:hypothetical protein
MQYRRAWDVSFSHRDWIFAVKWDGFRDCCIQRTTVRHPPVYSVMLRTERQRFGMRLHACDRRHRRNVCQVLEFLTLLQPAQSSAIRFCGAVAMTPRAIQIIRQIGTLLESQIRITASGSVECLTHAQWREYNKREAEIKTLFRELDQGDNPVAAPQRPAISHHKRM